MTLVTCPTCRKKMTQQTDNCPYCGVSIEDALEKLSFEDFTYENGITKECLECGQFVPENSANCPYCGFSFDKRYELLLEAKERLNTKDMKGFFITFLFGLSLIVLNPLLSTYSDFEMGIIIAGVVIAIMGLIGFIATKKARKKHQENYDLILHNYEHYKERNPQQE